jgi:hypothetical protein
MESKFEIDQSLDPLEEIDFLGFKVVNIEEFSRNKSILGKVA